MSRDAKRNRLPLADRLRAHREEMELARAEGITVLEARTRIAQRAARQHWQQTNARLQAKMNGQPAPSQQSDPVSPSTAPPPWMHFD